MRRKQEDKQRQIDLDRQEELRVRKEIDELNRKQMKSNLIISVNKINFMFFIFQIEDHVKQKTIEEELKYILMTLEKKLEIEQIKHEGRVDSKIL